MTSPSKDTVRVEHTPRHLDLGSIERHDGGTDTHSIPTDEALIFVDDDNEQTIHLQCKEAPTLAAHIIRAINAHEELTAVLRDILTNVSVGEELRCRGNAALVKAGDGRAR